MKVERTFAILLGCGLRRREAAELDIALVSLEVKIGTGCATKMWTVRHVVTG
jgi:predicted transcriptional regulator